MTNQMEDVLSCECRSNKHKKSYFRGLFFDGIFRNALWAVPEGCIPKEANNVIRIFILLFGKRLMEEEAAR
jgi:hypothetical protein